MEGGSPLRRLGGEVYAGLEGGFVLGTKELKILEGHIKMRL